MKYPKSYFALYSICAFKFIMTILAFEIGAVGELYCITITTIPQCLAMSFVDPLPYFIIICICVLMWCAIFMLSICGIFFKWARKGSIIAITIATVSDFLIVFTSPDVVTNAFSTIVSSLVLLLCAKCFIDTKKITR